MNYDKYIHSTSWAEKRKRRLALDGNHCRLCDEDGTRFRLEVHHRPSSYKKIPNESVEDDLITLCSRCHEPVTAAIRNDRYENQELPNISLITTPKVERTPNGMANTKLQIDFISPTNYAQRADGKPTQQIRPRIEKDFQQARQN